MAFLLSIFARLFGPSPHFTGVLADNRSRVERAKDYLHEEVEPVKVSDPFGNPKITQSPYPIEDQHSTSSCVSHAVGLALAITRAQKTGYYQRLSWMFNYRQRSNYPNEGYVIPLSYYNYKNSGAPTYDSLPNVGSETQANTLSLTQAMYDEAKIFKGFEYYLIKTGKNIDTFAPLAQNGTAIAISIYATYGEYAQQYPQVWNQNLTVSDPRATINHEVCILPNSGFIENGVKYLAVQDSAHFGGYSIRYFSEEFIANRCTTAGYWKSVDLLGGGPRPRYYFTRRLVVGDKGDDVKALQQLLIAENCLPSDCATGTFGGRTRAGLRAFQEKYRADILGNSPPVDVFGPMSMKKANYLCQ